MLFRIDLASSSAEFCGLQAVTFQNFIYCPLWHLQLLKHWSIEYVTWYESKWQIQQEILIQKVFTNSRKNVNFFRFLWPCIVSKLWSERENQKMQQLDVYF